MSPLRVAVATRYGAQCSVVGRYDLGRLDLGQYLRRLDFFGRGLRRHDLPRDVSRLMELSSDLELEDHIAIDREQDAE